MNPNQTTYNTAFVLYVLSCVEFFPTLHTLFSGKFRWIAAVGAYLPGFTAIVLHFGLSSGSAGCDCRETPRVPSSSGLANRGCRITTIFVLISTCSGISAPATLADSPTEFHAHRRSFTDPAPARRGASLNFSTCTLRPQTLSTAANLLNSQEDFLSPFRYTPALRRVGTTRILAQNSQNSAGILRSRVSSCGSPEF